MKKCLTPYFQTLDLKDKNAVVKLSVELEISGFENGDEHKLEIYRFQDVSDTHFVLLGYDHNYLNVFDTYAYCFDMNIFKPNSK